MRVYSYCRVSSEEQSKGHSLDGQKAEHLALANREGWPEPIYFADVESGSAEAEHDRKGQRELLTRIVSGDVLIVSKIDRWSRDLPFAVGSIRKLVAAGVSIKATSDTWRDAKSDDSIIGIMAWAADQERQRIKERTVGTRVRLRKSGAAWANGTTPVGYSIGPDKKLTPNEDAEAVREIYRLCAKGLSLHDIGRAMRESHPRTNRQWFGSQCAIILKSRVYLGEVIPSHLAQWEATDWVKGCHEPIVSEADWHRARSLWPPDWMRPSAGATWFVGLVTWWDVS